MTRVQRCWTGLLLACLPLSAAGEEVPKATPEGIEAAEELIQACVADGGLNRVGEGPKATWRIDPAKVRATLARQKERLTPEVRDTLIAANDGVASDDSRSGDRVVLLAVLQAFADETRDARAGAFAHFFTGWDLERRSRLAEAAGSYQLGAEQFAAGEDVAWQALCLNRLGSVLHAHGDYDKATQHLTRALEIRRRLYPADRYPAGHTELAESLNNLAAALDSQGEYAKARDLYEQSLEMRRRLYPAANFP